MTFLVKIECDNAAFGDEPHYEVARILRELARIILEDEALPTDEVKLRDINGNTVGYASTREDSVGD